MFNIKKLHPLVWIFNKAMSDPQGMIDYYENNKEWEGWYTFGSMVPIYVGSRKFNSFPDAEEWSRFVQPDPDRTREEEKPYVKEVIDLFYQGTKQYFEEVGVVLDNYEFLSFSLAKYNTGGSMLYHTDYQQERAHIFEPKFNTTCLFYLNDNYTGGEISFAIIDENTGGIKDLIDYKPEAGDMVIFPSNLPVYHGVKPITEGEKYIIRTYWKTTPDASADWEAGVAEYGLEEWKQKQEEIAKDIRGSKTVFFNNQPVELQGIKSDI